MLRFMSMGDIQVAKGHAFKPLSGDKVLGASDHGPILVSGARDGHRFVALGFDPRDSDLVLRIAWPLFVLNTINAFVEEDTGYVSSFRTGDVWHIAVPGSLNTVNLLEPAAPNTPSRSATGARCFRGELAGFYKLSGGADDAPLGEFAANLSDLDESRIAPQKELILGGKKADAVSVAAVSLHSEVWIYLLLAVLVVSLIEWVTYHPAGDGMSERNRRLLWLASLALLFGVLAFALQHFVLVPVLTHFAGSGSGSNTNCWSHARSAWPCWRRVLLYVLGKSLADLPWQQRALSVLLAYLLHAAARFGARAPGALR